jgi:hypothetical protein
MNLYQRVIVWLGCNALALVWILPPTYSVHADGTRSEHSWSYLWEVPLEWSVSVPLTALRLLTVVVFTVGMCLVFQTGKPKEGGK